eukprot:gene770-701_t
MEHVLLSEVDYQSDSELTYQFLANDVDKALTNLAVVQGSVAVLLAKHAANTGLDVFSPHITPSIAAFSAKMSELKRRKRRYINEGVPWQCGEAEAVTRGLTVDANKTVVDVWLDQKQKEIDENAVFEKTARYPNEAEDDLVALSSIFSICQTCGLADKENGFLPESCAMLWAEMSALQLEREQNVLTGHLSLTHVWPLPEENENEQCAMANEDAFSYKSEGREPPAEEQEEVEEGEEQEEEVVQENIPACVVMGRQHLKDSLRRSLECRHFDVARNASQVLALRAYGAKDDKEGFDALCKYQAVKVCCDAEAKMHLAVPNDHKERILLTVLKQLESKWTKPNSSSVFDDVTNKLKEESPFYQFTSLLDFPDSEELVKTHCQEKLVISLQMEQNELYAGCACGSANSEEPPRYFVRRDRIGAAKLFSRLSKMSELASQIERDMLLQWEMNSDLASQYETIAMEVAELVTPLLESIERHFYPLGWSVEHEQNPKGILFLVSESLMQIPWETLPWTEKLFGHRSSAVYRDLSLHCQHWRMKQHLGEPDKTCMPLPGDAIVLADPYKEDSLRQTEPQESELMHQMVGRLKSDGAVGTVLDGHQWVASSDDFMKCLKDNAAVLYLGFGRFMSGALSPEQFASLDLRSLSLLAALC